MGSLEKGQRTHSLIEVSTHNNVIEELRIVTPTGNNKLQYQDYALDRDGKYFQDNKSLDVSINGNPQSVSGYPKAGIATENMASDVTNLILKNNNKNQFTIKIDGNEVSYEDFCETLQKSDMLLQAKGIAASGYKGFFDDVNTPAHQSNAKGQDIELLGTPAAKQLFQEVLNLSKGGTSPITKDGEDKLMRMAAKLDDVEINVMAKTNMVQIIQDRHKRGSNYNCFDINLNYVITENNQYLSQNISNKSLEKTR